MKTAAVSILAMAIALAACDVGPEQGAAAPESRAPAATGSEAARPGASDAVAAVLQSTGTPVARLSFVIESRPVKGEAFAIRLLAAAAAPVPALELAAASGSLEISPATVVLAIESADTPVSHELIATAQQEGLAELIVRLKSGESPETVYAIPVLVMENTPAGAAAAGGG